MFICGQLGKEFRLPFRHSHNDATDRTFGRYEVAKKAFRGRKVVLVIRDPRDVVVSHWLALRYRARRPPATELDLHEWTYHKHGLPFVVRFYNDWGVEIESGKVDVCVVRYEDMLIDTSAEVIRMCRHWGAVPSAQVIERAVEASTFEKIQKTYMYTNKFRDTRSWAIRSGIAGGWRDHFRGAEAAKMDEYIDMHLEYFRESYT